MNESEQEKRETLADIEAVTDCNRLGNAAAMREALEVCLDFIMRLDRAFNPFMQNLLENAIAKANAALSAPDRQCDVGTAEEQAQRFGKLCGKYYNEEEPCNEKCPLASLPIIHGFPRCQAYWAQTPYEAEEGAGNEAV